MSCAVARLELEGVELRHAHDEHRDLLAELRAQLHLGRRGVLDRIVQKAGAHGGQVHAPLDQRLGDRDAVREVVLAGRARLILVDLLREVPSQFQRGRIHMRRVEGELGEQGILGDHGASAESRATLWSSKSRR
jgi:hypothetical protein